MTSATTWTKSIIVYYLQLGNLTVLSLLYKDLNLILRETRLLWFGHVECSSVAVRTSCDIQIGDSWEAGRPYLT